MTALFCLTAPIISDPALQSQPRIGERLHQGVFARKSYRNYLSFLNKSLILSPHFRNACLLQ
jgi:hypothetical protein